jgi:hypothetical protein
MIVIQVSLLVADQPHDPVVVTDTLPLPAPAATV